SAGKLTWHQLHKLLHTHCNADSPISTTTASFPSDDFSQFLFNKIHNLQKKCASILNWHSSSITDFTKFDSQHSGTNFTLFSSVTLIEVMTLIKLTDLKSSPTDSFPSALIKSCSNSFSVIISN